MQREKRMTNGEEYPRIVGQLQKGYYTYSGNNNNKKSEKGAEERFEVM